MQPNAAHSHQAEVQHLRLCSPSAAHTPPCRLQVLSRLRSRQGAEFSFYVAMDLRPRTDLPTDVLGNWSWWQPTVGCDASTQSLGELALLVRSSINGCAVCRACAGLQHCWHCLLGSSQCTPTWAPAPGEAGRGGWSGGGGGGDDSSPNGMRGRHSP
jgi:hypothetical protein